MLLRDRRVPGLRHLARQFRDALDGLHRLCLRYDPFLHEQMEEALAASRATRPCGSDIGDTILSKRFTRPLYFFSKGCVDSAK